MSANPGKIFVDFRENRSQVPKFLKELGVEFEVADLPVDYQVGQDCFIERKTVPDFITSIGDRRLFHQVVTLAHNFNNPLLLLEGEGLYQTGRVSDNLIRGIMIWITVRRKVPLLQTRDERDTACVLRVLARKAGYFHCNSPQAVKRPRKAVSPWQEQMRILTQIPGIGWQTAKVLLQRHGPVAGLTGFSDEELIKLPGMGEHRLKNLRQIFPSRSQSAITEPIVYQAK